MAKDNKELLNKMKENGNGKAVAVAVAPQDNIAAYLMREDVKAQLAAALPKHITPDRLARIALTTIRLSPALQECNPQGLIAAIMQAAQLGLEPGLLGHCYFVPFNKKIKTAGQPDRWVKDVQFIIGYKGFLDLARRTGSIVSIAAEVICSNDKFIYKKGFDEQLEHEPDFTDRGEVIGAYAYATTKDGGRYATVMNRQEIEAIRKRSKAADSGPWVSDWEEMAKKTVLRRLAKYLPLSIEFAHTDVQDAQREFSFDHNVSSIELKPARQDLIEAPVTIDDVEEMEREAIQEEVQPQEGV